MMHNHIGVSHIYQDTQESLSALPSTLNSQDITVELQSVPQEIRHNLEEAAALGDIERLMLQ